MEKQFVNNVIDLILDNKKIRNEDIFKQRSTISIYNIEIADNNKYIKFMNKHTSKNIGYSDTLSVMFWKKHKKFPLNVFCSWKMAI